MIPWETTMSCRPFMKTVIFLVLLLCCCHVPATDSRPVDVETPENWESNNERLEIKPKINNTRIIQEVIEQPEFGSKTSSNNNKNTSMVVRVIVSSSSSSSSDYDGEFSAFPVSHSSTSKTTATTTAAATTEEMPSSRATSPRSKITVLGVNRNGGQSTRYFLRPKRISRFTVKSVSSTTPSAAARTTTEDSTMPTSSGEMELNDGDTEKITKNSSEDIFSAFYKAFAKSMQENRSSINKTDNNKLINDNNNDNSAPVMSDSQNVERFQVYPQLIRSRIELAFNNSNSKFNRNSISYRKTIASIDRHNLRSNNNNNITDSSSTSSSSSRSSSNSNDNNNNNSETLDESGSGPEAKVVSVVTHSKSVAVNTHRSSKHVITNARPLPVRARPIYQPKRAEMAIDSVTVSTLKNSTPKKSGRSPIITSNSSPVPNTNTDFPPIFQALIQDIPKSSPLYPTTSASTTSSPAATSTIPTTTTTTTQKSSASTNSWHLPEKVWGEPAKIWGIQEKVWGEPEKVWGEPAKVWSEPARPSWLKPEPSLRFRGTTTKTPTTTTTIPLSTTVTNNTPATFSPAESRENKHKKTVQSLEDEEDEETNSPGTFFELGEDEEDDMENDGGGKSSWELPELSPQVDHTFVGERVSVSSINNNNKLRSSNSNNNSNKQFGVSHVNARRVSSTSSNSNSNSNSNLSGNRNSNGYNNARDDSVVDPEKEKSGKKFGYVLEGADVRKYRVEERTPDGYIVGEYGVLNNENGFLRGVRYTADGTINPRLIHEALMKFLAL